MIFVEPGAQTFKWRGHIVSAPRREWSWQVTATWFLAEEDFAEELRISESVTIYTRGHLKAAKLHVKRLRNTLA